MSDGEGKVTASECGCAVSLGWGLGTPKSRDEMGEGSEEFILPKVADVPIYLR